MTAYRSNFKPKPCHLRAKMAVHALPWTAMENIKRKSA
jgi:hypothetical protein